MLFNIAPQNAEKAKKAFTTARPAHVYGYTASAILTPKNHRMKCCYQIDTIHDIIVCTIRHQEAETVEAVITARAFTDNSIEIERAELYRNASNYPYRTETNDRYMRKYDQIACIIHGAIAAGLLFDVSENQEEHTAPQETTGATTAQDTTCMDGDPQRATEDAQRATETATATANDTTPAADQGKPENAHRRTEPAETVTGKEDTTTDGNEAQEATDAATTGDGEQTTTAAAPTPSGDRSTANKMTGSHAGPAKEMTAERSERRKRYLQRMFNELARKRRKARRDAKEMTTGRTTPPGHACEIAPGRKERRKAEHVPIATAKSPPRAKTGAGRRTSRASPKTAKSTFFGLLVILDPVTSEF